MNTLEAVAFARRNIAPYVSPILDAGTLALVCKDLGITGRAIPKVIKGRQYIAFSGYPGLRTIFPGTIYSANNRKLITMAIGALGIQNMVKTGGILTICITVPLTILEAFLQDHATCYNLLGNIASDLIKIGVASVMGAIGGILIGGIITYAIVPIGFAIFISVVSGIALNHLDDKYQLSEKLAITFLIFCNFLCLWVLWIGFNEIKEILASLQSHADVIRVGSRAGFFVVGIGAPILCLLPIVEKFWPDFLKKHSKLMSQCVVIGIIALLAAGVIGSSWIKARVENAGYTYCRNASGISELARTLVYTNNKDICEELVEAKIKSRRR